MMDENDGKEIVHDSTIRAGAEYIPEYDTYVL